MEWKRLLNRLGICSADVAIEMEGGTLLEVTDESGKSQLALADHLY